MEIFTGELLNLNKKINMLVEKSELVDNIHL